MLCAAGVTLLGVSGLFGRVMRLIPAPVIQAVLGGVLLRFGLGIFNALDDAPTNPLMIAAMVAAFFWLRRVRFRAPSLGALAVGAVLAFTFGQLNLTGIDLTPALPQFFAPTFSFNAALGLALPLFALALSAQYAPGQAVLLANGYDAPINGVLTITGLFSMGLALLGGHGITLGALTAAIVVGPDAQPDPDKRYGSAVASGVWHIVLGIFGTAIIDLFAGFPTVFVSTIAGLSLSGVIAASLGGAMERPEYRDAAVVAFLCTAGDFTLLGIGAPFWGLTIGVTVHLLMTVNRRAHV
jgi:benzoate membrane transport protein